MTRINQIIPQAGRRVHGIYRIRKPVWEVSQINELYCRCRIEDVTGSMVMYFIEPENDDFQWLEDHTIAEVIAHYENIKGKTLLIGETISAPSQGLHAVLLLPSTLCHDKAALDDLVQCVAAVRHPGLREFMNHVFKDQHIVVPYLTVPASHRHHHAHPSGLVTHSVEVAMLCSRHLPDLEEPYGSLLMVAALCHDIGKVWTHDQDKPLSTRRLLQHEALALEILARPLANLEREWQEGANALRYLLTWQPSGRSRFPVLPILNILRMADQLSSARDVERQAFNQSAQGQSIVRHVCPGPVNEFWRIA